MATEQWGPFSATVDQDMNLQSTVITLVYADEEHPDRSIIASIAPELGSNLFRLRVGDHDLIYCDHELLKQMSFTGNFVLWPIPNRMRDKKYHYQGLAYSLENRTCPAGNYPLVHGLAFDRSWKYRLPAVSSDGVEVTTYVEMHTDSPFFAGYPFSSRLSLTYKLTKDRLAVTYLVENLGETSLPFGFALHPYFALLSGPDQTSVSLPAATLMEADQELLPTGRLLDVTSLMYAMFDLRSPQPVERLRLDHVYTDLVPHTISSLRYGTLDFHLDISATDDFTHAVIYTPSGADYGRYVCLEHQTCSTDALNFHAQGDERRKMAHLLEVPAGESSTGSLLYTIVHH